MADDQKPSFWTSIPGVLTAIAALVSAIAGLMLALRPSPTRPDPFRTPSPVAPTHTEATPQNTRPGVFVPPPPTMSRMGKLMDGVAYLHADIYSRSTATAADCSELCRSDPNCRAMTFVKSQRLCWIKNSVPGTTSSPDMVSAAKLGR